MDFTLKTYHVLLKTLIQQDFSFQLFHEFIERPKERTILLRHDVDKLPENSLRFAQIQNKLGIKGSFYFRIISKSFNPNIIENIAKLGHEIGYHYEDIDFAMQNLTKKLKSEKNKLEFEKELAKQAIDLFEENLEKLRKYYPVKSICMHGSPLSKLDNKLLWKYYSYKDFGIIGEPYFDIDFSKVLYLTDTGRKWNGEKVSIRDKVNDSLLKITSVNEDKIQNFKKTIDIIQAAENGKLPNQIMFTFHPQRWTDRPIPWIKELGWQNTKNILKYFLNRIRSKNTLM